MDLINIFQYFGITPDKVTPLFITAGVILFVTYKLLNPVKKSVTRLTNATIEIQTLFETGGTSLRHHMIESPGSPLGPTEYGKTLIENSGLKKILDENGNNLKEMVKKKLDGNDTPYDIQEAARSVMLDLKNSDLVNPVKKYAYENGINVDLILRAGGLWLRDDYLGNDRRVN